MQNTRSLDALAAVLLDLTSFLNSPQRDAMLLRLAGVDLDRALFPLLVRLGMQGALGVAELADQAGRDATTVSRQIAKLEALGLVRRRVASNDRRIRTAQATAAGREMVDAIVGARRQALAHALAGWSARDREALIALNHRFVGDLVRTVDAGD